MAKLLQILFVAYFAIAFYSAEAIRSRASHIQQKRNNVLARQEAAVSPAVTPYPAADELNPEIPFDEVVPAEEHQSNQPDEVYGPPEYEVSVKTDDIAAAAEGEEKFVEQDYTSARFTALGTPSTGKTSAHPAKMRKTALARLQLSPHFVPQPVFYYVTK